MRNLVKDSRLAESYNEKARRGQSFEADLSKYDTKQQDVIKKAVESGVLNNTNRTHEFVDMIAKISADKGVSFDFTNNEKLKTSGFAVDGKTVNGFVDGEGNITLNANSSKWLNSVVGHEITHILEGTELYTAFQQTITEYAKTKGEYQSRYDALAKLYEGVEGANIDNELTADLVGDYLFSDSNFINSLSTEQPGLFKKIYNEIKYLYKIATAGSKEARELEKVKKAFDNAWKESGTAQKNTTDKGDVNSMVRDYTGELLLSDFDILLMEDGDDAMEAEKRITYRYLKTAALLSLSSYDRRTADSSEITRELTRNYDYTTEEIEKARNILEARRVISNTNGGRVKINTGLFSEFIIQKNGLR